MKKLSKRILSAFLAIIMLASVLPTGMITVQANTVASNKYGDVLSLIKKQISYADYNKIYKLFYGGNTVNLAT